jgi:hypothetical protein
VCGVNIDTEAFSVLAGESHIKSIFTTEAETSADAINGACPGDAFRIENYDSLPEFVTFDEATGLITVDAPSNLVEICHAYDIGIVHDSALGDLETIWTTLTVEPNCAVQQFVPLTGFPESIHYRAEESFETADMLSLEADAEGLSWEDLCGATSVYLESETEGVSVSGTEVIVSGVLPGEYTITIARETESVSAQFTDFTFIICGVDVDDTPIFVSAGDLHERSIFANGEDTTQTSFAWDGACPGATFEFYNVDSAPSFITFDQTSDMLTIEASAFDISLIGSYPVEILHTWSNGESEIVTIEVNVEANCEVQTWEPLLDLESPIGHGESTTFFTEEERNLVVDDNGESWDEICGMATITMAESSHDSIYIDENGNVQIEDLPTGIYTFSLEQSNDLVAVQVTDFEFVVCGVELNTEAVEMTAGVTEVHSLFAGETNSSMFCEGESFALGENVQSFMSMDDDFNLVIDPSADLVSHTGTFDLELLHYTADSSEPTSQWITVSVAADCEAQTWSALEGFPSIVRTTEIDAIFDSNDMLELVADAEGNSWTELCGSAELSLATDVEGVLIDNNQVYATLNPGSYSLTLVQSGEGVTDQSTDVEFSVCGV